MNIPVLGNGYVFLVEAWGTGLEGVQSEWDGADPPDYEVGIIEAARQSTQGAFRGWDQDKQLLKFLHDNRHATPFEFAGMVIEVQAPIFVFREWHRHRTQSYNEASARYSPLPELYYLPNVEGVAVRTLAASVSKNKQEASMGMSRAMTIEQARHVAAQWLQNVDRVYQEAEMCYQQALQAGIPKELARITMPVGHYTKMRASGNLRNWLAFLTLRQDPKAQHEIRMFANAVGDIISKVFPQTARLFYGAE